MVKAAPGSAETRTVFGPLRQRANHWRLAEPEEEEVEKVAQQQSPSAVADSRRLQAVGTGACEGFMDCTSGLGEGCVFIALSGPKTCNLPQSQFRLVR